MPAMNSPAAEAAPSRPVANASDAEALINHLVDVMDGLLGVIEQETTLVRAGKLAAAAKLEPKKQELSQLYMTGSMRLKASQDFLAKTMPDVLGALRRRHELFKALLQINLTVLATESFNANDKVLVSVRPEDVELSPGKPQRTDNVWEGIVDQKVFLGEVVDLQVKLGERVLLSRQHPSLRSRVGEPIFVQLDPEKCVALRAA